MGGLKQFFKESKAVKENVKRVVSNDFVDEKGDALEWEFKVLTTNESEKIRDICIVKEQKKGKFGQFEQKLDTSKYMAKLISSCVVYPDLNDVELQNSYGVMSAEELIKEMVDKPGDYTNLSQFVQEINGFNQDFEEDVEQAKN